MDAGDVDQPLTEQGHALPTRTLQDEQTETAGTSVLGSQNAGGGIAAGHHQRPFRIGVAAGDEQPALEHAVMGDLTRGRGLDRIVKKATGRTWARQ